MIYVSKLPYVIGVIIIMHNSFLNFWNCLQIILLKCVLEKITILRCVSNRDWKRKKSSKFIQQINIQFIWCLKVLWCIFKRGDILIGDTSQVTFHTWDGDPNFNWLNHHFNLPWHLHRYDRNYRTAGRVQLNECGSIHTFEGVQRKCDRNLTELSFLKDMENE